MSTIDELAAEVREQLDESLRIALAVDDNSPPWPGRWEADGNKALRTYNGWVLAYRDGRDFRPGLVAHWVRHDPATVLRDVAAKRALVDRLLAEKHHVADDQYYTCPAATRERDGGTYAETDGGGQCDCGRDERVAGYLGLMVQAWQEET